jgi:protein TonB
MGRSVGWRLTASLLAAVALHGALLGVAAAVLSRRTSGTPAPVTVEVELIAPRPDPVADSAPTEAAIPAKRTAPRKARTSPSRREVALVNDPEPNATTAVSAVSASSAPPSKAGPATSARVSAAPSGHAVFSAVPSYRTNPTPDYPLPCKRRREEGIVLLNVFVEANGQPTAISLKRTSGYPLLDRAALDAVRHWTFEPGRAAGLPVSSTVVVPVHFSLSDQP